MNKQLFQEVGITEADYKKWCKDNKKPSYKSETKEEFFARIQDGRLVKDKSGNLIRKNRRR